MPFPSLFPISSILFLFSPYPAMTSAEEEGRRARFLPSLFLLPRSSQKCPAGWTQVVAIWVFSTEKFWKFFWHILLCLFKFLELFR